MFFSCINLKKEKEKVAPEFSEDELREYLRKNSLVLSANDNEVKHSEISESSASSSRSSSNASTVVLLSTPICSHLESLRVDPQRPNSPCESEARKISKICTIS